MACTVTPPRMKFFRGLSPVAFLLLTWVLALLLCRSYPVQSDEGYTLNAAWQVWSGLKMYDDFRLFVGPGAAYSVYWLWRIVGAPSFLAARSLSLALSFSSITVLYLLLRRAGVRGVVLATTVVLWVSSSALCVLLNHNSFSAFAASWFLLPYLRIVGGSGDADAGPPSRSAIWAGMAAGAVFVFVPMKGCWLVAAAIGFWLWISRGRGNSFRTVAALLAAFVAVIAPLFIVWRPATLVRNWVLIPLAGDYLGHTTAAGRYGLLAIAILLGMGWGARRLHDRTLGALAAVQAALFMGTIHNLEPSHLAINAFPALVFAALASERVIRAREGAAGRTSLPATALMALFAGAVAVWMAFTPGGRGSLEESTLYVDFVARPPRAPLASPRIAAAHAIYAGPFLPGLYYLFQKKNPFFVSETVVCDATCQRALVVELAAVRPELAFLDYQMARSLHYDADGPVDVYLRDHYRRCPTPGVIEVRALDPSWCP